MCQHPGCAEAKLIYLHLKTCSCTISNTDPCPTQHKGCADARKLLNHYRRCRDIRSRQVSTRSKQPQHVCLVCSIVARHAKAGPDRNRSTSPKPNRSSTHLIPSLNLSEDGKLVSSLLSLRRPRSTSPHHKVELQHSRTFPHEHSWSNQPGESPLKMPPPPPKLSLSSRPEKQGLNVTFDLNAAAQLRSLAIGNLRQRPRAESLDIRYRGREEIKERDECPEIPEEQEYVHRRRRSASCSVLSSSRDIEGPSIDPILEEPTSHELKDILEGES